MTVRTASVSSPGITQNVLFSLFARCGTGSNGSFVSGHTPEAAVLIDCAPLPGKGLLVLGARTSRNSRTSR
ncbi:hypothetical protein SMICM304S_04306 [Streptomyces microflavus]